MKRQSSAIIEKSVIVPAGDVVAFLRSQRQSGTQIIYAECLYKWPAGGTRPSMELSATAEEIPGWVDFEVFVADAAMKAQAVAVKEGAEAFFEIGIE